MTTTTFDNSAANVFAATPMPKSGLLLMEVTSFDPWRRKLTEILGAINNRSSNRYSAETLMAALEANYYASPTDHLILLCVDMARAQQVDDIQDAVVGFCGVDVFIDHVGTEFATLTYGWVAPGYRTRPVEKALMLIESWARARGLSRLLSFTERSTEAYARWIGRWGYRQRETVFEKELRP